MRNLKRRLPLESFCIKIMCILAFVAALGNTLDGQQESSGGIFNYIYFWSLYFMFLFEVIFLSVFIANNRFDFFSTSILLFLIYITLITYHFKPVGIAEMIRDGYAWPLCLLTFYLYFKKYHNLKSFVRYFKKVLKVGSVVIMLCMVNNIRIHLRNYGDYGRTIGSIYYLVAFVPFFLAFFEPSERFIYTASIVLLVTISTKRTAFLIILMGYFFYYVLKAHYAKKLNTKLKMFLVFLGAGTMALVAILLLMSINDTNTFSRLASALDDKGSGRVDAWNKVILYFLKSESIKKVLGHGFHAVPKEVMPLGRPIYAHCSYLEVLYDIGIFGLLWLVMMLIYMCVKLLRMVQKKTYYAPVLVFSMINILLLSLLGYFYEQSMITIPISVMWGIFLGTYNGGDNYAVNASD